MGGSSGGGGHTPYEAPDSLRSAQRLRAIGLISLGPIKGAVNKWKSTYFDNTPIQNENGIDDNDEASFNFKNTEIQFNLGTQDQPPLKGFESSEREVSVGAEVKKDHPLTRSVIDPDITRIRLTIGVNALFTQNDQGDTNGTSVFFEVLINNRSRATYEISGKSSSRFFRSYIIDDLPPRPFTITVKRLTEDSKSQRLQNATHWASYTEIIDTKLNYPNMAIVGIKTDSRYNPNFPNVNFLLYGRIIKIPTTYDPENRTYAAGIWKGDFKLDWTNNPAWIFYDLVTDKLAGLGQRVSDYGLDKFQLYEIAKYCDELVDDGYGGKEPRMTANLWITDQRSAYDVVSDMASVFRAIAVWNGIQFTAIQDRPADPVCCYTQSNVINGKFSRQFAAGKAIFTAVEVEYADEKNLYQKAIEYVPDDLMIARYGYNVKKITAFACTSRGQAHRYGKWVLETSRLEQCTITFTVGRQGLMHLPGDIIEVADNHYAGKVLGGRVLELNGKTVTLDQAVEINGESYLSYLNDEMKLTKVKIQRQDSQNPAKLHLAEVPVGLDVMGDWILKTPVLSTQLYRAISISENDDGSYTVTALQHEPQKESIVDGSASFVPAANTVYQSGLAPVQNAAVTSNENGVLLTFTANSFVGQGLKYQVKLYRDSKLYDIYDDLLEPSLAFKDLPDGAYIAEIRAKNSAGQLSEPQTTSFNVNFTVTELIATPKIFAIDLSWKNPLFANANSAIEIWVSADNDFRHARKLVSLAYPTNNYTYSGLSVGDQFWFWVRMTSGDTAGRFTPAVAGVPSNDATQLTEYLHGKITKSELGQSLIESLQADIDLAVGEESKNRREALANTASQITAESRARVAAINAEVTNRTKAIAAESANLTKKIQAEATARGTAITQLQHTDRQQAQQITALTTKADNALAGLEAEKTARANGDKAEATARNALTTRVSTAEGNIATIQRTVATQSQSLSEMSQNLNAKIDGLQIGGRNYLLNSKSDYTGNRYLTQYRLAKIPEVGETVTVTLWGSLAEDRQAFGVYNTQGYRELAKLKNVREGVYSATFRWNQPLFNKEEKDNAESTHLNIYAYPRTATSDNVIKQVKLELGTLATDWSPAPEDAESEIAKVSADLTAYKQTQATTDTAQAQQLTALTTRMSGAEGNITNAEKSISTLNSTTATKFNQLEANLNGAKSDLGAKITAEQTARANGDKANADKITALTSRVSHAEGSITNIQSTKANKTEVASLAQSTLQSVWRADAKAEVDKVQVGGRNLLLNSRQTYQVAAHAAANRENQSKRFQIVTGVDWSEVRHLAISIDVQHANDLVRAGNRWWRLGIEARVEFTDGTYAYPNASLNAPQTVGKSGRIRGTYTVPTGKIIKAVNYATAWVKNIDSAEAITLANPKLEIGTLATDWSPAPEDTESAVNLVSAKIDTVQTTLSNADKALSTRIDTVTSSVNNASAQISTVSRTVADVNGKLSATHTIKTQTIAGGRKAIAGIALGATADNKTAESSVIVMADKFGVVKNASDSNVISMLSVANNKVAINGDLIADGSILGKHIRASQSLTSPNINGGNITGSKIKGNVIEGGTINGSLVTGTTINGGVIRGARIEGVTVEADNIIGDVAKFYVSTYINDGYSSITIPATKRAKRVVMLPVGYSSSSSYRWASTSDHYSNSSTEEATFDIQIKMNGATKLNSSQHSALMNVVEANNGGGGVTSNATTKSYLMRGSFEIPPNTAAILTISALRTTKYNRRSNTSPINLGELTFFVANI